jgi:hypothetical protein
MTGTRCRNCKAPLITAELYSRGAAPSCPYCGAWYPFGNRPLWIVLGLILALLMIYAFFKLTRL